VFLGPNKFCYKARSLLEIVHLEDQEERVLIPEFSLTNESTSGPRRPEVWRHLTVRGPADREFRDGQRRMR
jgi:hypothetical protein